ncbi:MAG: flagellar hook protein FlgE [Proteobacteria bacterium]|nr:flagellar hook protein FlgE [Pseudomonadota bacterium]HQR05114.1 flagellar hook protein FlgE [Rhodocyclaceae bacterium]
MSFQQGLSGLGAASTALDAIGNNVANSGTVGFKSADPRFSDVFAASLQGGGTTQAGVGVAVNSLFQQFTQGNVSTTNNPLDLAINGAGFFRLSSGGTISYSRAGQFQADKNGFIVNTGGAHLTGYAVDSNGNVVPGAPVDLQINTANIPPKATTQSQFQLNLDSRAKPPAAMSHGALTGTLTGGLPATTTITAGVNDTLSVTVDGVPASVTIPAGAYSQAQIANTLQGLINTGLGTSGAVVTVSLGTSPSNLVIQSASAGTSGSQGSGSSVTFTGGGGNAVGTLFQGAGDPAVTPVAGADNFSVTNALSYTGSTAQTVFDTLGNPHNLTLYFAKANYAGRWQVYTTLDGGAPSAATVLNFNSSGALTTAMPVNQTFTLSNGAQSPLNFTLDLTGTTQYGISFGTNQLTQDGYTSGRLSGMSVSSDGILQGRYSNGKTRNLGQLVLVNFNNANGLQSLGSNLWAETSDSGQPIPGTPAQGNLGAIQSAAVEESNVDLTAELVRMITQQRAYQANAQTIKTQDQVLQTLVNLR